MNKVWILTLFLLFWGSLPAQAEELRKAFSCGKLLPEAERERLLGAVESHYGALEAMNAQFEQESFLLAGTQGSTSTGSVQFKKPGKMNWVYQKPDKQQFVSDGETFWFYQPDANQVTVLGFDAAFSSDVPVSFLLGIGKLRAQFNVKQACQSTDGFVLEFASKTEDEELEEFYLLVRKDDYIPIGARIIDFSENETLIRFESLKLNQELKDSSFQFEIPRGVDVIDQRTAGISKAMLGR